MTQMFSFEGGDLDVTSSQRLDDRCWPQDARLPRIFSDWPATLTYYAN